MFNISGLDAYANAVKCIDKLRENGIACGETVGGVWVSSDDLSDDKKLSLACDIAAECGGWLHPGDTPLMAYQKEQMEKRKRAAKTQAA